jgi:hypothetical protein
LFDRYYCGCWLNRIGSNRWGISLEQAWQEKVEGGYALRSVNASATRYYQ